MGKIALENFIKQSKDEISDASITYNNIELFLFIKDKNKMLDIISNQPQSKDNKKCMER